MNVLHPYPCPAGRASSVGLLAVRLAAGSAFIFHGWPKIKNAFAWMGPDSPVPGPLQAAAAVAEFGGGIAWVLGLLTPVFSFLILCTMGTAVYMVHLKQGDFANADRFVAVNKVGEPYVASWELAAVYASIALLLLLAGPGCLSADACLFGKKSPEPPR
jgi:putative oxidoreductase